MGDGLGTGLGDVKSLGLGEGLALGESEGLGLGEGLGTALRLTGLGETEGLGLGEGFALMLEDGRAEVLVGDGLPLVLADGLTGLDVATDIGLLTVGLELGGEITLTGLLTLIPALAFSTGVASV